MMRPPSRLWSPARGSSTDIRHGVLITLAGDKVAKHLNIRWPTASTGSPQHRSTAALSSAIRGGLRLSAACNACHQAIGRGGGRTYTRQQGELLHPEHEPAGALIELKREMGPIAFSAQYQQNPIPPGGAIVKRKWLATYDQIACQPGDRVVISWDIALSETESGD